MQTGLKSVDSLVSIAHNPRYSNIIIKVRLKILD